MIRHPATDSWAIPQPRPRPDRVNLMELVARPERFEHHLVICAQLGPAQLEVVTASEPLYFAHVNLSDEYAVALPTGDPLLDRFPFRTFVSDPVTGTDVARYNHRAGDLVLHPVGLSHWPGRLRPPYEPLAIPRGMRRCGLSLVYCAATPTPSNARTMVPAGRTEDVKLYDRAANPTLALADLRGPPGVVATIGSTQLELVVAPTTIAPPRGGWVVVLEGDAPCDLVRVAPGTRLDGADIARALVLSGDATADPVPPSWRELPAPAFAPFEDAARGQLPFVHGELRIEERSAAAVVVTLGGVVSEVPRYWLARTLFRIGLHGFRLGYIETYGGMWFDDRTEDGLRIGLRVVDNARVAVAIALDDAVATVERMYRAVAPVDYRERLV